MLRLENDADIYTTFTDLFMLLFMFSILMMGNENVASQTSMKAGLKDQSEPKAISLIVDQQGKLQHLNHRTVTDSELQELLTETSQIVLHVPGNLSLDLYGKVHAELESSGASSVSYVVERGDHHD